MANITKINVDEQDYYIQGTLYDELGTNTNGAISQAAISSIIEEIKYDTVDVTDLMTITGAMISGSVHAQYTDFSTSSYIKVLEGDIVLIYGYGGVSSVQVINAYDINKNLLSTLINGNNNILNTSVPIPTGCEYIKISMCNSTHDRYQEGSYAKVQHNNINKIKTDISNISSKLTSVETEASTNKTFKISFPNDNRCIKTDGTSYVVNNFACSTKIYVNVGTTIIVNGYSGASSIYSTINGYDENMNFVSVVMEGFGGTNKVNQKVTITNDEIKYVLVSVAKENHSSFVRNDCYVITTTDIINKLYNADDTLNYNINETESPNIVPVNSRLDENTVLTDSYTTGWAKFRNDAGSATINTTDNCVEIVCPNETQYEGIRNDNVPALWKTYDEVEISAEVRWVSENSPKSVYFYWAGNPNEIHFTPSKTEWKKITKILPKTATFSRMQFCLNNQPGTFQVRNFKICNAKKPLYGMAVDNQNSIEELDSRVTMIETAGARHALYGKKIAVIGDSISTIYNFNTPSWTINARDVGQTIEAWVTHYDVGKTIGGVAITDEMNGYKHQFTPTADDIGKTIGEAYNYNNSSTRVWSQHLCDLTGCELVCNASWSGAQLVKGQGENEDGTPKSSTSTTALSYAWSDYTLSRFTNNFDEDGNTIVPDVIFIYRGTNDATHSPHGYFDKLDMKDGLPTTDLVGEKRYYQLAANILVSKLRTAFPNVTIYFCTMNYFRRGIDLGWTRRFGSSSSPLETLAEANDCIRDVANKLGCGIVEFDKDGISPFVDPTLYYRDGDGTTPTHPNTLGHLIMAKRAMKDVNYVFTP